MDTLVVELVDADGRSGFGEAPQVWQVTGASVGGSQACVREMLGPQLIGRDPDDLVARCAEVQRAVVGNEAAKAAVDVALHDLAAQRLGVPLVRLLGGTTLRVPTDVTLAAGDAVDLAAAAAAPDRRLRRAQAEGRHRRGRRPGPGARYARRRPGTRIRLDANQGWTPGRRSG
ncbi:hypothetical protein NKG94_48380 [Micromonospora sp. M12]